MMKIRFSWSLFLVALILMTAPARAAQTIWIRANPEILEMFPKKFLPEYTWEVQFARMEGEGKFRLYVNKEGVVTKIGVVKSTGHESLDLLASGALVQWRAKPGRSFAADIVMVFKLGFPHK